MRCPNRGRIVDVQVGRLSAIVLKEEAFRSSTAHPIIASLITLGPSRDTALLDLAGKIVPVEVVALAFECENEFDVGDPYQSKIEAPRRHLLLRHHEPCRAGEDAAQHGVPATVADRLFDHRISDVGVWPSHCQRSGTTKVRCTLVKILKPWTSKTGIVTHTSD